MQESVIDAPSSQGTATQLHGEVSENLGEHSPWSSLAPGLTASSTHEACVHHALGRGLQSFCTCRARGSLRPRSFDEQSPDSQSQQTAAVILPTCSSWSTCHSPAVGVSTTSWPPGARSSAGQEQARNLQRSTLTRDYLGFIQHFKAGHMQQVRQMPLFSGSCTLAELQWGT